MRASEPPISPTPPCAMLRAGAVCVAIMTDGVTAHPSVAKPWLWAPGRSANPNGKAKKTEPEREAERLAKTKAPWAIRKLIVMAENRGGKYSDSVELAATNAILDRALGKPAIRDES